MGYLYSIASQKDVAFKVLQLVSACGLSLFFVILYSLTNLWGSIQPMATNLYFSWETHIPLIPIFIIPYMSIDLLFFIAPFLSKNKEDLYEFNFKIILGILVASVFFILMPVEYAFERPVVDGMLGKLFTFLHGFDKPFNLFPSLHIILAVLLASQYKKFISKEIYLYFYIWFILIALSTLFTHQHHLPDLILGYIIGETISMINIDNKESSIQVNKNVGKIYLIISLSVLYISITNKGYYIYLLYPFICFMLISITYLNKKIYLDYKINGRIKIISLFILFPWIILQKLSVFYYSLKSQPISKVNNQLYIGKKLSDKEYKNSNLKFDAVLDLSMEDHENKQLYQHTKDYLHIPIMDLTAPTIQQLQHGVNFIKNKSKNHKTYVHCKIGFSRSACYIIAYLLYSKQEKNLQNAIKTMKKIRPNIVIRPEIEKILKEYQQNLNSK